MFLKGSANGPDSPFRRVPIHAMKSVCSVFALSRQDSVEHA
jgi:hypothetical protein